MSTAYQVCDLYIGEANKTAKQITGGTKSTLIIHAREACVNDILTTNDLTVSNYSFLLNVPYLSTAPLLSSLVWDKCSMVSSDR